MPHQTSFETCERVELKIDDDVEFVAARYFPPDFKILNHQNRKVVENNLKGKPAPDWILEDVSNNTIAFRDLKSAVTS